MLTHRELTGLNRRIRQIDQVGYLARIGINRPLKAITRGGKISGGERVGTFFGPAFCSWICGLERLPGEEQDSSQV
jgi:hypothetical protein